MNEYLRWLEETLTGGHPGGHEPPPINSEKRAQAYDPLRWQAAAQFVVPRSGFGGFFGVSSRDVGQAVALLEGRAHLQRAAAIAKRLGDVAVAGTALLIFLPAFLAIAFFIRLDSRGPATFTQTRVGLRGKEFRMLKFRTMHVVAEERLASLADGGPSAGLMFKMRYDPRVTKLGRVLRRTSLDELPQLWNVLKGEMSLVGPRPPLRVEVDQYDGREWQRLQVRPGLTGLWQVSGRADLSWQESIRLDLRYVENWSLTMDLLILWRTVRAVVQGSGAY